MNYNNSIRSKHLWKSLYQLRLCIIWSWNSDTVCYFIWSQSFGYTEWIQRILVHNTFVEFRRGLIRRCLIRQFFSILTSIFPYFSEEITSFQTLKKFGRARKGQVEQAKTVSTTTMMQC